MIYYAAVFLIVALIAGVLGFSGIAGTAANIAWILFVVGLVVAFALFVGGHPDFQECPSCKVKRRELERRARESDDRASSIAASISAMRNGWPLTLVSDLASTRNWSRSTVLNWPVFISGTRMFS